MPLRYDVGPKTGIGRQIQELAEKLPYKEWYLPNPYEPSNFLAPIGTFGAKGPQIGNVLRRLGERAGKKGWLTTARQGLPKGKAGTFFGTSIPKKEVSASFPTVGKDVGIFLDREVQGAQSSAPLADAISWNKTLDVPKDVLKKIKNKDSLDQTWTEDIIGAISAKRKGLNVLHFIHPETAETVTVNLSQHTEKDLLRTLDKMLVKKGKGEPFNLLNYRKGK